MAERELRPIVRCAAWGEQRHVWRGLVAGRVVPAGTAALAA